METESQYAYFGLISDNKNKDSPEFWKEKSRKTEGEASLTSLFFLYVRWLLSHRHGTSHPPSKKKNQGGGHKINES